MDIHQNARLTQTSDSTVVAGLERAPEWQGDTPPAAALGVPASGPSMTTQ
jgi:hypothetical protein